MRLLSSLLMVIISICAQQVAASESLTWVGPITVISDKFEQSGGIFGYTHTLDQGDCCCGGPATEDRYPDQIRVDEKGNIAVGDRWHHMHPDAKIRVFNSTGKLMSSFSQTKEGCTSGGYLWPGHMQLRNNKIIVETGNCAQVYNYDGKLLWHLGRSTNSYPELKMVTEDRIIFRKYLKDPFGKLESERKDIQAGWLIYSLDGKLIEEKLNFELPQRKEGVNVVDGSRVYSNVLKATGRYGFRIDKNKNLIVFRVNEKPDDYEQIHSFPAGTLDIYDLSSKYIYTIVLPQNEYSQNRYCGEGAFAGKDVIAEYGEAKEVDINGNIYLTLFLPTELKIIKWIPLSLNNPLPVDTISNLDKKALRILRNEIYARKGRKFESKDLADLFSKQPWYTPIDNYSDHLLSKIDRDNIDAIFEIERKKR